MKKIMLKKMMYGMIVAVLSTSAMVAMDRGNTPCEIIIAPWGNETARIEALDSKITDLESQIITARTALSTDDQAVQRALRQAASPARPRGTAEPAEAKKGLLGGYGDVVVQSFKNWTEYLMNNKEYWKKQHTEMVAQYDRKSELSLQIFTLYAELAQMLKEKETIKTSFFREENAVLKGSLEHANVQLQKRERNLDAVNDIAKKMGVNVRPEGSKATRAIDVTALESVQPRQIKTSSDDM